MKNFRNFMFVATVAMAFAACTAKDNLEPVSQASLSFSALQPETRTTFAENYKISWVSADQVGVYVANAAAPTQNAVASNVGADAFKAEVNPSAVGDNVYAYYPYNAAAADHAAVTLSIPAYQQQSAPSVFNGAYNPLVAVPQAIAKHETGVYTLAGALNFRQTAAMVEFGVYSAKHAGEKVRSIELVSATDIAGDFSYNLSEVPATGDMPAITLANASRSVKVYFASNADPTVAADKESASEKVYMCLAPGTHSVELIVTTNAAVYRFAAKSDEFKRAHVNRRSINLDAATAVYKEVNKSAWKIAFCNTEHGEGWGNAHCCIDGNKSTSWHTYYDFPEFSENADYWASYHNDDFFYRNFLNNENPDIRFVNRPYYYPSCWSRRPLQDACIVIDLGQEVEFDAVQFEKHGYDLGDAGNGDRSLKKCKVMVADAFEIVPCYYVDENFNQTEPVTPRENWQDLRLEYTSVSNSANGGWTEAADCFLVGGWEPRYIQPYRFDTNGKCKGRYIKLNPYETYHPWVAHSVVINEFSILQKVTE